MQQTTTPNAGFAADMMTAPNPEAPLAKDAVMSPAEMSIQVASLLASRLCHDLVNPVGALSTGLDVLAEGGDEDLKAHAIALIRESTQKSVAVLTLARLAFGSSGGVEGDLEMGEARRAAEGFYEHAKATLEWKLLSQSLPKAKARCLLNLVMIAERSVPREGSTVTVSDQGGISVTAAGRKVKASDALLAALDGKNDGLEAKETPAYLASLLAAAMGATLNVDYVLDDHLRISIETA